MSFVENMFWMLNARTKSFVSQFCADLSMWPRPYVEL